MHECLESELSKRLKCQVCCYTWHFKLAMCRFMFEVGKKQFEEIEMQCPLTLSICGKSNRACIRETVLPMP
jgi:hypothetical protein